jgi:signal transduction histidine kinase
LLSISELLSTNFDSLDEEDKIAGIQGFHNSAKRIYSLLENLLIWSRAQTGRIKYAPVNFNLSQLANDNINLFSLPASEKGITLHLTCADGIYAWGDPEMMDLVFRNLLHNAIKYSTSGSQVTVEMICEKPGIKISIHDQGIGIPKSHLNKLFNLASNSTTNGTSGEKGSGLGLIVCKEFVERHGSRIEVKSEENKGSVFSFYLNRGNA